MLTQTPSNHIYVQHSKQKTKRKSKKKMKPDEHGMLSYKLAELNDPGNRNTAWEHILQGQPFHDETVLSKSPLEGQTVKSSAQGHKTKYRVKPYNFPCEVCGVKYRTPGDLRYHMGKHTGELPYKCRKCNKRFANEEQRNVHDKDAHRQYTCEICGYSARIPRDLKYHMGTHTQEKEFQCDQCEKGFVQKSALSHHIRCIHTDEKPWTCSYCGKGFKVKARLQLHERRHTGERPYQCSYCVKSFVANSDLKDHARTHTGERPYKCKFCGKTFVLSTNRNAHEKIHTGEKPHQCDLCGAAFIRADFLKRHRDNVHKPSV